MWNCEKDASCMRDGSCSKQFAPKFSHATSSTKESLPLYRRGYNSGTIEVGGIKLGNRLVVPYNPWISMKFNANINIENCSTGSAVKYLYKYVYKAMIEPFWDSKRASILGLIRPGRRSIQLSRGSICVCV